MTTILEWNKLYNNYYQVASTVRTVMGDIWPQTAASVTRKLLGWVDGHYWCKADGVVDGHHWMYSIGIQSCTAVSYGLIWKFFPLVPLESLGHTLIHYSKSSISYPRQKL